MSELSTPQSATAIGICFPIICSILVVARFSTRQQLKVPVQIDDWLCLPALMSLTGCCAALLADVFTKSYIEAPIHEPDAVTKQERLLAHVTATYVIFWLATNTFVKLSVLFFYRRIFVGKIFNICNWTLVGLSILWSVYACIAWILYCGSNIKANFEGGWLACNPWGMKLQIGVFALDSFVDCGLLILPMPFLWRLQLDLKRKIAISTVFVLGAFSFIAGLNNTIIQLVYLINLDAANTSFFQGSSLLLFTWPTIEVGVGLIACNIPSLSFRAAHTAPKMFRRAFDQSWSSIQSVARSFTGRTRPISSLDQCQQNYNKPSFASGHGPAEKVWKDTSVSSRDEHKRADSQTSTIPLFHKSAAKNDDGTSISAGSDLSRTVKIWPSSSPAIREDEIV